MLTSAPREIPCTRCACHTKEVLFSPLLFYSYKNRADKLRSPCLVADSKMEPSLVKGGKELVSFQCMENLEGILLRI